MNHYRIEAHRYHENECCRIHGMRYESIVNLLFFTVNDFYLVSYNSCLEGMGNDYDFRVDIIKKVQSKCKSTPSFIERSHPLDKALLDWRHRGIKLKKWLTEVNYIYADMTGKLYGVISKYPYLEGMMSCDELENNYNKAKEYLINGYDFLIPSLDNLYQRNMGTRHWGLYNEIQVCRTIDDAIKKIRQTIKDHNNEIDKKSKLKGIA